MTMALFFLSQREVRSSLMTFRCAKSRFRLAVKVFRPTMAFRSTPVTNYQELSKHTCNCAKTRFYVIRAFIKL